MHLGEDRYQNLSPPYFIGSKAGWTTGIVSKEREELATFVDFRNDWFDNLLPSFMPLELKLDQSSKMKTDVPTRLVYSLVCTYLHKTAEMKHTETISSFLKRMNVGQRPGGWNKKSGLARLKNHYHPHQFHRMACTINLYYRLTIVNNRKFNYRCKT